MTDERQLKTERELAMVRHALPPLGAPPTLFDLVAEASGLDGDTAMRRLAQLCAAGEASLERKSGKDLVRRREPVPRFVPPDKGRSRFLPESTWIPATIPTAEEIAAREERDETPEAWWPDDEDQ